MTDVDVASAWRRSALPLLLALSILVVSTYYASSVSRIDILRNAANNYLLGAGRSTDRVGVARAIAAIPVLAADPLNQQLVTGVIAVRAQQSDNTDRALRETRVLRQLGWRSTSALQNQLWRGGTTRDLPLIMDTMDALLRREKLLEQIYPVLNLMTTDPEFRVLLIDRLRKRPAWRYYYFLSASNLKDSDEIDGRYEVMRGVQRSGDRLLRNEIAPILPRLLQVGRGAQAFALWRTHVGTLASPLADTNFAVAARPLPSEALPVSFEWQLGNGSGYFADASTDARGHFLSLDWNGIGAPTFVNQVTSARPGAYRLMVSGDIGKENLSSRLGFRLTCLGKNATEFTPTRRAQGGRVQFATDGAVPCAFPTLELYGLVKSGIAPAAVILRSIQMIRVGP